jgi:hypothetical protein
MKLVTLALIALATTVAVAQSNTIEIPGVYYPPSLNLQIGCPVAFTDVVLKRDARYMPVKQGSAPDSSLAFNYKNSSGKLIESISIRVELKVKRSIYDLDATTITRYMTLTGTSGEVLPLNLLTYGLGSVTLEQVTYVGGEVWTPGANKNCRYVGPASAEQIGTLQ